MPTFVSIEPSSLCQLQCSQCPIGKGQRTNTTPFLNIADFDNIISQLVPYTHTILFYFQGEPLLNPNLTYMIKKATQAKIFTIVSTNAQNLTPHIAEKLVTSGLNQIIVSIDGLSQKVYEQYRKGGSVQKCTDGLRYLHQYKQKYHASIKIIWQCIQLSTNEKEWTTIKKTYKNFGADTVVFKTAQLDEYKNGNNLMPTNTKYCRYIKGNDGLYSAKHNVFVQKWHRIFPYIPCHRLWTGCVIDTSGNVLPCCYDKKSNYVYGNLHAKTLKELFQSDKAKQMKMRVLKNRVNVPICANCDG